MGFNSSLQYHGETQQNILKKDTLHTTNNDTGNQIKLYADLDSNMNAFPATPFEGSEKRIEICFDAYSTHNVAMNVEYDPTKLIYGNEGNSHRRDNLRRHNLRDISRADLDAVLQKAQCSVINEPIRSIHADAYLLSESTMFVEKSAIVIKTCGTTKLLAAIPALVKLADEVCKMEAVYVKYSRASYLFPDNQPLMHSSWEMEITRLRKVFCNKFGSSGNACRIGDEINGLVWHIFTMKNIHYCDLHERGSGYPHVNCKNVSSAKFAPSVEMCMTDIPRKVAKKFFKSDPNGFSDALTLSEALGIRDLLPRSSIIDEYMFEPCGYSMNALNDGGSKGCMHVTPEEDSSFVSHEVSWDETMNLGKLIKDTIDVFQPLKMSILITSRTAYGMNKSLPWINDLGLSLGYKSTGLSFQQFPTGGYAIMTSLHAVTESKQDSLLVSEELQRLSSIECSKACNFELQGAQDFPFSEVKFSNVRFTEATFNNQVIEKDPLPSQASDFFNSNGNVNVLKCALNSNASLSDALSAMEAVNIHDSSDTSIDTYAQYIIQENRLEDTFYVMDLGAVRRRWDEWQCCLPRVEVHYAVKCNPDIGVIATMASLGSGFDCASISEFETVLSTGVDSSRIIYANPCKPPSHAKAAIALGIDLHTFDSVFELKKLAKFAPKAQLLLRIRADDVSARCQLGSKYGAEPHEIRSILRTAFQLNSNVIGVSFHIGSGAGDPRAFPVAIAGARKAFDIAKEVGFKDMTLLDIGGGFSGGGIGSGLTLREAAPIINNAIERYFPQSGGVRIIAEPGRYFVESAATLYTKVIGRRHIRKPEAVEDSMEIGESGRVSNQDIISYYISDGLYGSMNCLFYDHAKLACRPLFTSNNGSKRKSKLYKAIVFGPTCDGLDKVMEDVYLPFLDDDWLVFPSMGAYTLSAASNFNGFDATAAKTFYIMSGHSEDSTSEDSNSTLADDDKLMLGPDSASSDMD